ncbi:MAG: 50S ribosomal protein L3 N(5)-glutamine methyltransferase [Gammaproteobacteria bacterium]|nr:50S ribosomal protein L3 N(5)-glutamine methyltransferase [Gammaproteobacteria bacterium]
MLITNAKTTRDYVQWAADQFTAAQLYFGHGTDNAWDEAAYLVAHALHQPWDFAGFNVDAPLSALQQQAIEMIVAARIQQRLPAPYLTHEAWFAGLAFYVDQRVLVPRSPLAELILDQFRPWTDPSRLQQVLDIGTGSGCIACAIAYYLPGVQVDACDISSDALAVARINIDRHGLHSRVQLFQSDLLDQVPPKPYDIIISNPPYVDARDMGQLPAEFQREPALGLAAGGDGLDCVRRILRDAVEYLHPQGLLIVEVGNSEAALQHVFAEVPFTWLACEQGDDGVFLLEAVQVRHYHDLFTAALTEAHT